MKKTPNSQTDTNPQKPYKKQVVRSGDWQDLGKLQQSYQAPLSLHVTTVLSVRDKAVFYTPSEAGLICATNAGCQTSRNELRQQSDTPPPGWFSHSFGHRRVLSSFLKIKTMYTNARSRAFFKQAGECLGTVLGVLAVTAYWTRRAVLIQTWGRWWTRGDRGQLTLDRSRGRPGQTGKVTRPPQESVCS